MVNGVCGHSVLLYAFVRKFIAKGDEAIEIKVAEYSVTIEDTVN